MYYYYHQESDNLLDLGLQCFKEYEDSFFPTPYKSNYKT